MITRSSTRGSKRDRMKRSTHQTALLIASSMVSHAFAEPMTFASPTNIFAPVSTPAKSIFGLSMFVLAVTAAIGDHSEILPLAHAAVANIEYD
jgi:hypothetical protein